MEALVVIVPEHMSEDDHRVDPICTDFSSDKLSRKVIFVPRGPPFLTGQNIPRSQGSSTSSTLSYAPLIYGKSSMAPISMHQSPHPFLTPKRASDISIWTSSLPGRNSYRPTESDPDSRSREAAIEAYRQLKATLFARATSSNTPRPT